MAALLVSLGSEPRRVRVPCSNRACKVAGVRKLDAVDVGRWRGMQTTATRVSATAPAPRIALRIIRRLSGCHCGGTNYRIIFTKVVLALISASSAGLVGFLVSSP